MTITLDSIRNVMKKRSYTALSPRKRLAHQDQMAAEMQSSSPIHQNIQNQKDKERAAKWKRTFQQAIDGELKQENVKPKKQSIGNKPKKQSEKKQSKSRGQTYPSYGTSVQQISTANRRTNRTYGGKKPKKEDKIVSDPRGNLARAVGRQSKQAKEAKRKIQERRAKQTTETGRKRLARTKSVVEINKNFNSLLDAYQDRWFAKSIFDEQVANQGKTTEVTGTAARGAKGTDHRVKPKPLGSTTEDKKVMQS